MSDAGEDTAMAVNLTKGQKISLVKQGTAGLSKIMVGLGWDEAQQTAKGWKALFAAKPQDIDCDASVILLGEDGKLVSRNLKETCIFYGNQTHPSGAIAHQGDNLTGGGEGDDEQIMIDLTMLPENIQKIAFTVTIYEADERMQNFGQVTNAFIRIVDEVSGRELIRYDLGEDFSIETAIVVGELYKMNGEWRFNAIGSGFQGGLKALCDHYGIDAE
jgi:tellurium resistance protein TerD